MRNIEQSPEKGTRKETRKDGCDESYTSVTDTTLLLQESNRKFLQVVRIENLRNRNVNVSWINISRVL